MKKKVLAWSTPIDARMKPGYPGEVLPAEETVNLVNQRWKEYGLTK